MPSPLVLQGAGTSMTFPNGFSGSLLEISRDGVEVDDLDVTDMATAADNQGLVWQLFQPTKLVNPGSLKVKLQYTPDGTQAQVGIPGTVVVTFPVPPGKTTGANWSCAGYVKSVGEQIPLKDKMTQELTIKFSGKPTYSTSS